MSSPEPALVLTTLDDGCIRLTYGPLIGTVSSHHLVPSKAAQLHRAWCATRVSAPDYEAAPPETVINPSLEAQRQRYIEMLYDLDGRASKDHPYHSCYTGLLDARRALLLASDFELLLSSNTFN